MESVDTRYFSKLSDIAMKKCLILCVIMGFSAALLGFSEDRLLISNHPEKVFQPGHIVHETLDDGPLRVLYHHQNMYQEPLYVKISVRNTSAQVRQLKVVYSKGGPDHDEVYVGHVSSRLFLEKLCSADIVRTVPVLDLIIID